MSDQSNAVTLPPGVTILPGRETSQAGPTGSMVQGMLFTLKLPNGAETNVFVAYDLMRDPASVSAMFAQRVAAINAVANLGN